MKVLRRKDDEQNVSVVMLPLMRLPTVGVVCSVVPVSNCVSRFPKSLSDHDCV